MSTSIQKSILQRARDFLQTADTVSATELYTQLEQYRNEIHPDRFIDDETKKNVEQRFAEAQNLLTELFHFIQAEAGNKNPTEMVRYKPIYDSIFLRHALDAAKAEITELKAQIKHSEGQVDELNATIKKKDDESFAEEQKRIEKLFKPTVSSWASLGLVFVLSALMATMSKIREVSDFITQYSPFSEGLMKTTLFVILLVVLTVTLKQYIEGLVIRAKIQDICSARFSVDFLKSLSPNEQDERVRKFAESDVFDFIAGKRAGWKVLLGRLGFKLFQTRTYETLKDYFIGHLLKKELIKISYARDLERTFTINSAYY